MYTLGELMELMKEREDLYSVLDLLPDLEIEEFIELLEPVIRRNYDDINEFYEEDY